MYVRINSDYNRERWRFVRTCECDECAGEGVQGDPDYSDLACPTCDGKGEVWELAELEQGDPALPEIAVACEECKGTGCTGPQLATCENCNGEGKFKKVILTCSECKGMRFVGYGSFSIPCNACLGLGQLAVSPESLIKSEQMAG